MISAKKHLIQQETNLNVFNSMVVRAISMKPKTIMLSVNYMSVELLETELTLETVPITSKSNYQNPIS